MAAGVTVYVLVGGVPGCLIGLAAAFGIRKWWRARPSRTGSNDAAVVREQLPLAADLLVACMAAGAGPRESAAAVGASIGGPVGEQLAHAAAELRLGGEPAAVWGRLGELPGARGLARCLERSMAAGVPAVEPVSRLAADCRAEQSRAATARARRAAVLATAPLGLCFLPAFLTVGVAPVLLGLTSGLLSGG
ncbi:type II secretion system F family protein [Streptomyces sp. NPDC048639]|uniref:type II secretion system F family protein n=1 Tax=Streptomyces sp. NPDC048639 TaxID=3365581 RepID=UPI0037238AFA